MFSHEVESISKFLYGAMSSAWQKWSGGPNGHQWAQTETQEHWHRLSKGMKSPFLEIFRSHLNVILGNLVRGPSWSGGLDLEASRGPSQTQPFCYSVINMPNFSTFTVTSISDKSVFEYLRWYPRWPISPHSNFERIFASQVCWSSSQRNLM